MGEIKVTVQTEDRLRAINNLCEAIKNVSKALASNVRVDISDCHIQSSGTAIAIDASLENTKTEILETP